MMREPYPNELYHHGILGQRWGRRRFQNPDGSYTPEGRRRYGILGFGKSSKRKMSKDAKLRAKARTQAKNEAARQQEEDARTARLQAQVEAERAKKDLREAKRENSAIRRAMDKASEKADRRREKVLAKQPTKMTANEQKIADALEAGDKKKIEKVLKTLNNDEYRRALDRINMKYSMDMAERNYKTQKMRSTVDKISSVATGLEKGTSIYNVAAGVISAFGGKDIPKINTQAPNPLDQAAKTFQIQKAKAEAEKAQNELAKSNMDLKDHVEKRKAKSDKKKSNVNAGWDNSTNTEWKSFSSIELSKSIGEKPLGKKSEYMTGKKTVDAILSNDKDFTGATRLSKRNKDWDLIDFKNPSDATRFNSYTNIDIGKLPKEQQDMFWRFINQWK